MVYQYSQDYLLTAYPTQAAIDNSDYSNEELSAEKPWVYWVGIPRNEGASYENQTVIDSTGVVTYATYGCYDSTIGVRPAFYLETSNTTAQTAKLRVMGYTDLVASTDGKCTYLKNVPETCVDANGNTFSGTSWKVIASDTTAEPADWNVKYAFPAGGTPTLTLRGAVLDWYNESTGQYSTHKANIYHNAIVGKNYDYTYNLNIIIAADSYIATNGSVVADSDYFDNVNITSIGNAKLTTHSAKGIASGQHLSLNRANLTMEVPKYKGSTSAPLCAEGGITINGGNYKLSSKLSSSTTGGDSSWKGPVGALIRATGGDIVINGGSFDLYTGYYATTAGLGAIHNASADHRIIINGGSFHINHRNIVAFYGKNPTWINGGQIYATGSLYSLGESYSYVKMTGGTLELYRSNGNGGAYHSASCIDLSDCRNWKGVWGSSKETATAFTELNATRNYIKISGGTGSSSSNSGTSTTNPGTSVTPTTPTVPNVSASDIKQKVGNIQMGPYAIKGAEIDILGYKIPLINLEAEVSLKFSENLRVIIDSDGKIKVLLGFDENAKANIEGSKNSTNYWSESYQEVKSMYQQLTGKKVDTTRLWNRFSSMRGKLKTLQAGMVVKVDAEIAGYLEFQYKDGKLNFCEGGVIASLEAATSLRQYFGPAYVSLGIEAGIEGTLKFVNENSKINPQISVEPSFTLAAGGGIGTRSTYAEIDAYGKLMARISTESDEPFEIGAELGVRWKGYLIGKIVESVSGSAQFVQSELYPDFGAPWKATRLALTPNVDVSDVDTYKELLNSAESISRDYLYRPYSLRGNAAFGDASFVKQNAYPLSSPNLVRFDDDTMLLIWVDDTGEKSNENMCSLMYSYFDGASWSDPATLHENGTTNDMPCVYSDGKRAYIVWQKATKVFEEGTETTEMLKCFDLYATVYDSETDAFSEAVCINPEADSVFEFNPVIYGADGAFTVVWFENSDNNIYQMSGGNALCASSVNADGEITETDEIVVTTNMFTGLAVGADAVYYSVLENENSNLYSYNESSVLVAQNIKAFDYESEKLFYTDTEGFYVVDGETVTLQEGVAALDNFDVTSNGDGYALFTSVLNEDFTKDLYYSTLTEGAWTEFEVYANAGKYIRDYSPTMLSNGTILVAFNYVDDAEENATIVVDWCTDEVDIAVTYVDFDESQLGTDSLDLQIGIKNNSSTPLENLLVTVQDSDGGTLFAQEVSGNFDSFAEGEITATIALPSDYDSKEYTVQVMPIGKTDLYEANNSAVTTIACIHSRVFIAAENEIVATCKGDGSYENVTYCYGCGTELNRETVTVTAQGHNEVADLGCAANCINEGITDGSHCVTCGEVMVAQETIPALGHTYDDYYDANCNLCSEAREVGTFKFENYRVVFSDSDATHKNLRAVVYKLGDATVEDPSDENALKKLDSAAVTYWGASHINKILLTDAGNYVVLLKYNIGTGAAIKVPMVLSVNADPKLIIDKNNKITAVESNGANINHRAVVYYLGDQTVEDIYDEAALTAIDGEPETIWKINYINRLALTKGGNYVLHLCYNEGISAKLTVAQAFTVESIPSLSVDINNKVVVTEENAENRNHRAVVYYLGENTVEDPYDESEVKAAALTTSKTYWGLDAINKVELKDGGNYVVHLYYNVGTSEKRTLALDLTLNERPVLSVSADGKLSVTYTDPEINNPRAYIYNVGDAEIADIYDEAALKKIATPTQVWGLSSILKKQLTPGTYVVHFYYSVGTSAKKTVALKVTI